MIFLNTAFMKEYKGNWANDVPVNGGLFIEQCKWGGEVFNFQPYKGNMYGYVEPGVVREGGPQRRIGISKLMRLGEIKNVECVSGVLIIWVARPPKSDESVMVGWYENASLYQSSQKFLEDPKRILPNGSYDYFAVAEESYCQLIPVGKREITIPRGAGAFGHSNIWYARSPLGEKIKDKVIDFINKRKNHSSTS